VVKVPAVAISKATRYCLRPALEPSGLAQALAHTHPNATRISLVAGTSRGLDQHFSPGDRSTTVLCSFAWCTHAV
jgi:hypothetical protein